jgi:hypothetical protein
MRSKGEESLDVLLLKSSECDGLVYTNNTNACNNVSKLVPQDGGSDKRTCVQGLWSYVGKIVLEKH